MSKELIVGVHEYVRMWKTLFRRKYPCQRKYPWQTPVPVLGTLGALRNFKSALDDKKEFYASTELSFFSRCVLNKLNLKVNEKHPQSSVRQQVFLVYEMLVHMAWSTDRAIADSGFVMSWQHPDWLNLHPFLKNDELMYVLPVIKQHLPGQSQLIFSWFR